MSEDATQQLLIARVEQLISTVQSISGQIENFEKKVNERLDDFENRVNERLDKFEKQQQQFSVRLDNLEKQQRAMNVRLDNLEKQQSEISARLEHLETIVDQRLYDTRPIWESVLARIAELDKKIDARVDDLRAETASGFRAVDRKIGALSKNLVDMTAEIQELREMVEKLDAQPA